MPHEYSPELLTMAPGPDEKLRMIWLALTGAVGVVFFAQWIALRDYPS